LPDTSGETSPLRAIGVNIFLSVFCSTGMLVLYFAYGGFHISFLFLGHAEILDFFM
jgi:hypothetical protein